MKATIFKMAHIYGEDICDARWCDGGSKVELTGLQGHQLSTVTGLVTPNKSALSCVITDLVELDSSI